MNAIINTYRTFKSKISSAHPWLALGNLFEGITGIVAIACGIYALVVYGSATALLFSLVYSIMTTTLALRTAWVL